MKKLLRAIDNVWTRVMLVLTVVGVIGTIAIAGSEAKKKVSQFEKAIVNLERLAQSVEDRDFLVDWLLAHGEDSIAVLQWTVYPRRVVTDTSGAPLLNVLYLESSLLPERGVLMMHVTSDSVVVIRELWNYPKEPIKK
jgi:hypothetical protein